MPCLLQATCLAICRVRNSVQVELVIVDMVGVVARCLLLCGPLLRGLLFGVELPRVELLRVELLRVEPKMRDTLYKSHAAIIQSSGSGKSRMVDEVSKLIFTIPFNIREAHESAHETLTDLCVVPAC